MGHFKSKDRSCKKCHNRWIAHEEKETDVNIALYMLNGAYKAQYDKAYLLTRDSDLVPAVSMIRQEFPRTEIVVVAPPLMGHSNDLIRVCNSKRKIHPNQVFDCLLPEKVYDAGGNVVAERPAPYAKS
jgi:uncharacterized LabA/DUF88 family protein